MASGSHHSTATVRRPRRHKAWRRHLRATREGKAFILVSVGVGFAAFNTGNNLLYLVLGFMLSLIVLSGVLSEMVLRRVRVQRRLPRGAHAEAMQIVELVVRNRKRRLPSLSLDIQDVLEGESVAGRGFVLKLGPLQEQRITYRLRPMRRGCMAFEGYRLATRYPFGLFEKWRWLHDPWQWWVYPALRPGATAPMRAALTGVEPARSGRTRGLEPVGLREYREGDEARDIHWRRSASLGRVVVKEREPESDRHVALILDNVRPANADASWTQQLEERISRAATLVLDVTRRGGTARVLTCSGASPLAARGATDGVLAFLARLQPVEPGNAKRMPERAGAHVVDLAAPARRGAA